MGHPPRMLKNNNTWSEYFKQVIQPQPAWVPEQDSTTLIPLAGAGSRFAKVGYKDPKPLIEVSGKPMILQAQ